MKFMDLENGIEDSEIVLLGIPYDGTTSYKPGAKFGPMDIRVNSIIGYETYSPILDKDLIDKMIFDGGDLEVPYTNPKNVQDYIYKEITKYVDLNKKVAIIGGEHSISYGVVKALNKKYDDLIILHFDAHTDLREEYLGDKYSHASVMKRISEEVGGKNIYQFGIRSGLKEEFDFAKNNTNLFKDSIKEVDEVLKKIKDRNVYVTIDLDILDPAYMPGTGTPEPGGISSKELFDIIYKFRSLNNLIGFDIVELAPRIDNTQISTAMAIKLLREMLIIL